MWCEGHGCLWNGVVLIEASWGLGMNYGLISYGIYYFIDVGGYVRAPSGRLYTSWQHSRANHRAPN